MDIAQQTELLAPIMGLDAFDALEVSCILMVSDKNSTSALAIRVKHQT
jgi:hypothetical protein